MMTGNVQQIYEEHIAGLTPAERLRLVELITRGMAQPDPIALEGEVSAVEMALEELRPLPGWQSTDRRGDLSEWRDRAL